MASRIEDYALVGDLESAALVSRDGTIDWLCLPRFHSDACFAALLGTDANGRWALGPTAPVTASRRAYRDHSLVLDTELDTATGTISIADCMPVRDGDPRLVRVVTCRRGEVEVASRLSPRFGYGDRRPWTRAMAGRVELTAAPDSLSHWCDRPLAIDGGDAVARFTLRAGESVAFTLAWHAAHVEAPACGDARAAIDETLAWWAAWTYRCAYRGPWRDTVVRSLVTLKALTYAPTGGIVAAPTTSLPEQLGGVRNWDYRYCWLRDTALTLSAFLDAGYEAESIAFATWLQRTVQGDPARVQIMYSVTGQPRLTEVELPWLEGYESSKPVRIGNAASEQLQLDVYGELVDCFHQARQRGVELSPAIWDLQRALVDHLEAIWRQPDRGIWEIRGEEQHFTFSKVMAWAAFDRMIKDAETHSLDGPVAHWRELRAVIHADVCTQGYDPVRGAFTQVYGKPALDASLLLLAQLGFLPASDPRVVGTVAAVRADLLHDDLVHRYDTRPPVGSAAEGQRGSVSASATGTIDGLPPGEGVFLPCSFWLADAMDLAGDREGARAYFEKLLALCNDLGLLSEQYDPAAKRLVGNFPQAFTHLALVRTAVRLGTPSSPSPDEQPAARRPVPP